MFSKYYIQGKALKRPQLKEDLSLLGQPPLSCTKLMKNQRTPKPDTGAG